MYSNAMFYPEPAPVLSVLKEPAAGYGPSIPDWFSRHPDIFGTPLGYGEVMDMLREEPETWARFQKMNKKLKQEFIEFCMGIRGLNLTYDPMFKRIFDPELAPERLEEFISLCLGEKMTILKILPNESRRLTEDSSLLVMDILMKMESGALVNVEIQRVGYLFPGQRCACYSSDLVMRQYMQVRQEKQEANETFSYKDIKKVYTIVLIEKSSREFHEFPDEYIHYAKQQFNTGLKLDLLQEYVLVALDIFRANHQNISNKLEAWLYFISSDKLTDIRKVTEAYPEFLSLYQEVFRFRYEVKELTSMFSEALSILDRNTVQLMIEQQYEEARQLSSRLDEAKRELGTVQKELGSTQRELDTAQRELDTTQRRLFEKEEQTKQYETQLARQDEEIRRLQALLSATPK